MKEPSRLDEDSMKNGKRLRMLGFMETGIEAKNLSRSFFRRERSGGIAAALKALVRPVIREKKAVLGVNFEVPMGSCVGLIGANGAGKTTLLKMIAGLLHPTGGEIRTLGVEPFKRNHAFLKQIGMVMGQKSQLWVDIPAIDTFNLLGSIYGVSPPVCAERIRELSKLFGVAELLGVQVRRLSLGERMKMEIIASLIHSPSLLILDEPTIGLDLLAKEHIRNFINGYRQKEKSTIILSSHDMEDISELCNYLLVISRGNLIYAGSVVDFEKERNLKNRVLDLLKNEEGTRDER
jgi:ABC-2 type transport system ATP-binding protein